MARALFFIGRGGLTVGKPAFALEAHPVILDGEQLSLNYATSAAGSLQAEIQEPDGTPIAGFAQNDCPPIVGDDIERCVSWSGGSKPGKLAGRPVRLRFIMQECDLFSIQFR